MEAKGLGISRAIARYVAGVDSKEIPQPIYAHAKVAFLDWLAVTMAGKDDPLVAKLIQYTALIGGKEQASVLGHSLKRSVDQAALVNGAASHALDYDDTMKFFLGHPSVTLFPGVLAMAEWKEKNGTDFLAAYITGLQVGACLGTCAGPEHFLAGWHGTSTIGRMAAAAACSRLLGLGEQQTLYALGVAATQAGGLKNVFGTMCKPLHAGTASQGGVMAALLAQMDFTCSENILEGSHGFFQAFKGKAEETALLELRRSWSIESLAQKYHASCHYTHSPIEAVIRLMETRRFNLEKVKAIRIYSSRMALEVAAKDNPQTSLEGKFSIRYCVANAALGRDTGMQGFTDERVRDPEARKVMEKISVHQNAQTQGLGMDARAEIETEAGEIYSATVDIFEEIPELKTKETKIGAKFKDICAPLLGREKTEEWIATALSLEKVKSMKTVVAGMSA